MRLTPASIETRGLMDEARLPILRGRRLDPQHRAFFRALRQRLRPETLMLEGQLDVGPDRGAVLLRTLPLVVHGSSAGAAVLIRDVTEVKRRDRVGAAPGEQGRVEPGAARVACLDRPGDGTQVCACLAGRGLR